MDGGTTMDDLPMIKCSSCGVNVDIFAMGDHVCGKPAIATPPTPSPPPPPPKSSFRRPTLGAEDAWASKPGRADPPSRIDPARANRPFLLPSDDFSGNKSLVPSPLSTSPGPRSPLRELQRSQTTPVPVVSPPPQIAGGGEDIPNFPLPQSMSGRMVNGMTLKEAISAPPAPSPAFAEAMGTDMDRPPHSAHLPLSQDALPPLPQLPKDNDTVYGNGHQHTMSMDSKSSYRTSLASTRYDNRNSKRSTVMSSRRPSFGSVTRAGYRYEDDIPPIPLSPRHFLHHSVFSDSSMSETSAKREGKSEVHSGIDFDAGNASLKGDLGKQNASPLRVSSNTNSERLSSSRGSAELFFSSPAQSTYGPPLDLPELDHSRSVSPAGSGKIEYKAFKPSGSEFLQPNPADQDQRGEMHRKNSDATSESALSVSNFARALGLDIDNVEDSATSSDSSPSETRSGTSLSSIQSDTILSRRKPSDQDRLGPVAEDHQIQTQPNSARVLDDALHTESPTSLEPPRIPDSLFCPDSPTDPALVGGGLSLIPDRPPPPPIAHEMQEPRPITRSATEPAPRPLQGRPRGPCRGCGETIMGKSISSADGRLTGRYHRACFVCFQCRTPFETNDFYVLNDRPYCAQHYHERNGSICAGCHNGIEGQYLETNERTGSGPSDRQKFHPECLRCRTCQIDLKGEYFEWNGLVYCERDARRAAAAVSPHRFRRPTMPSSPLAPPYGAPPSSRGRPPPPGYPSRGGRGGFRPPPGSLDSYGPPPPGRGRGPHGGPPPPSPGGNLGQPPGPRRFPERRTTKLMMI
ncbi:hypothetical protein BJX63DRAFT_116666 [Aspergillus granulosus]|uniref:LIM zinc-binding domain-containing protein n=1 Tax=Aspergillus granulosus TaxID=176169 RepID=A0ABR4HNP1_9EURO